MTPPDDRWKDSGGAAAGSVRTADGASSGLETAAEAEEAIARFRSDVEGLRGQIGRVIVGHESVVEGVLVAMFCSGHVLLEGVPGLGKTLLVRTLARALDLSFSRIQFTPDLMPADITGTTIVREVESAAGGGGGGGGGGGSRREFVFEPGPVFGQMLLADEINRATPKTQSALLEAMQERSVTVGGVTHALPRPFFVLATQNPLEQEGTYPLPEAQLDRFFFKVLVGYSSREELSTIVERTTSGARAEVERVMDAARLIECQRLVERGVVTASVRDYAVRAVLATHPRGAGVAGGGESAGAGRFGTPMTDRYVRVGASPRAAQALVLGAKCRAMMRGRAAAGIEDVQALMPDVLRHRILLNFEAAAEGVTPDQVVANIVSTLPLTVA
ncbi:MAG: AAA family ATPase [Phycisphaeraceae bacterium]|nr:AAA family ATPase [Phycisphaeraceae bacterium]